MKAGPLRRAGRSACPSPSDPRWGHTLPTTTKPDRFSPSRTMHQMKSRSKPPFSSLTGRHQQHASLPIWHVLLLVILSKLATAEPSNKVVQPAQQQMQQPVPAAQTHSGLINCKQLSTDHRSHWARTYCRSPPDAEQQQPLERCQGGMCTSIPMPTPWSHDVNNSNPWPEYPRPQLQRPDWLSLNGVWEFEASGCGPCHANLSAR